MPRELKCKGLFAGVSDITPYNESILDQKRHSLGDGETSVCKRNRRFLNKSFDGNID